MDFNLKLLSVIKNTNAYNILKNDKENNKLSHAYLLIVDDEKLLKDYALIFAKLLMCESNDICNNCRICNLIDKNNYSDVIIYPKNDKKIKVGDVDELVSTSYLKPLESDKKLFVLLNSQDMNIQSQNKLLKTLEEPTKNTHLLLVALNTYSLLPTVLSRVKKLELAPFSDDIIKSFLPNNVNEDISILLSRCDGKIGEAINFSNDIGLVSNLVCDILLNLEKSSQIYKYANKISKENVYGFIKCFIDVTNKVLKCIVTKKPDNEKTINEIASKYNKQTLIYLSDKLIEAEKSYFFNGNANAIFDKICLGLLEGKYKWQKLLG